MAGKLALLTGGNRGIGLAVAQVLRDLGYGCLLVARDTARLREAANQLGDCDTLALDLAGAGAAARVVEWLGDRPVDVLVNNAGVAPSDRFESTSDATLRQVLTLHVEVPFALTRAVLPGMKARASGTIVQLASTAGLRGFPFTAAYAAAKHGLLGMTRALVTELGESPVRVFGVCPGFVDTDLSRAAAAKVAARGKQTAETALAKMGQLNRIGRLHSTTEIAEFTRDLLVRRPPSGIFDLDHAPPQRVD